MEFTKHFNQMLEERSIKGEWVSRAIQSPDRVEDRVDGNKHFIKQIPENGNRWLRVIVNTVRKPNRAVTVFFDRRLGRDKYED
jgi:hypothetical protein